LSAVPAPDPSRRRRRALAGEAPSRLAPPSGCSFHLNCPIAVEGVCDVEEPTLRPRSGHPGHVAACHLRTGDHRDLDPESAGRVPSPDPG
jgi:oligopeptide/dipeptide ABC transporter ATP-binding protein